MTESKPKTRPTVMGGKTIKTVTGCGNAYITLNTDEDSGLPVQEVFMQIGKSGQCARVQMGAMCKLVSHALRAGIDPERVMLDLLGETCSHWDGSPLHPRSCVDALGRAIGFALGKFNADLAPEGGDAHEEKACTGGGSGDTEEL